MKNRRVSVVSVSILPLCLLSAGFAVAASIPAWLDDAITTWNQENPELPIEFVDIKDSFVWYMVPHNDEIGVAEIRQRIQRIVEAHGYEKTVEEELVTTGKPPTPLKPYQPKKCWRRSYTLTVDVGRQRMLTTMVCQDTAHWFTGFRIVQ